MMITTTDFTATLLVTQTANEGYSAINNVPGWWSVNFEGSTANLNDVFTVRFGTTYVTAQVTELMPGKKIVWHVTDCNKPWLKDAKEWKGTTMCWDILSVDGKTQIHFVHKGLVPEIECFEICADAWSQYVQGSLGDLITTGKGRPSK